MFGASHPGPIWQQFMADAAKAMKLDPGEYRFDAPGIPQRDAVGAAARGHARAAAPDGPSRPTAPEPTPTVEPTEGPEPTKGPQPTRSPRPSPKPPSPPATPPPNDRPPAP